MQASDLVPQPWTNAPGIKPTQPALGQSTPDTMTGVVKYLYAGGSGYPNCNPVWSSSEVILALEDVMTSTNTTFRWGADVAVGAADAMFALLLYLYNRKVGQDCLLSANPRKAFDLNSCVSCNIVTSN
jgi:hypothetical protein